MWNSRYVIWMHWLKSEKEYKINKELYELRNMIEVALLIVRASIKRKENRGVFVKDVILYNVNSN